MSKQGLMANKRGIIFGVANEKSLAWGIAKALADQGAEIAFSYQGPVLEKRVKPLAESIGSTHLFECDVTQDGSVADLFTNLKKQWDTIDFVVHAISFSDKNELTGKFLNMTKENFLNTMLISCYSFVDITKEAAKMMPNGGSILTLSYYGGNKIIPHYNTMALAKSALETSVQYAAEDLGEQNIRVNALSCGPIKTLASSGIGDMRYILKWTEHNSPMRRGITLEDVGGAALFALSDLGSGVTAQTIFVDCGYSAVGMKAKNAPDITLVQ
jgi:enoyl-[acyl-carrier protein] reductase I